MRHILPPTFPILGSDDLATITGGCHKQQPPPPPPQQQMAPAPRERGVSVEVATGAAASQLISSAQG